MVVFIVTEGRMKSIASGCSRTLPRSLVVVGVAYAPFNGSGGRSRTSAFRSSSLAFAEGISGQMMVTAYSPARARLL